MKWKTIFLVGLLITGLLFTPSITKAQGGPPWIGGSSPASGSIGIYLQPLCVVAAYDLDGDLLTIAIYENSTGAWQLVKTVSGLHSGEAVAFTYQNANSYNTKYWWKVTVDDGEFSDTKIFNFTTIAEGETPNQPPVADFIYSINGLTVTVNSTSYDPEGNITGWKWCFGDGYTLDGPHVQNTDHTYSQPGTYTLQLFVFDNYTLARYKAVEITVGSNNDGDDGGGGWTIDINESSTWLLIVAGLLIFVFIIVIAIKRR